MVGVAGLSAAQSQASGEEIGRSQRNQKVLSNTQNVWLLVGRYPPAPLPTIDRGGVLVTELLGEGADAPEFLDDVFGLGLGHEDVLRFSRNDVNVENVHRNAIRVLRKEATAMHVTKRLRELRLRAGLSMGAAAKALGLKGPSSYQRYEDADLFKDELLPLDIARKLSTAFAATGKVSKEETLALSGLTDAINDVALRKDGSVPLSIVEDAVRAFAEFRQEDGVSVTPDEESEMVSKFCSWYFTEVSAGRKPKTMIAEDAKSLFRLLNSGHSE